MPAFALHTVGLLAPLFALGLGASLARGPIEDPPDGLRAQGLAEPSEDFARGAFAAPREGRVELATGIRARWIELGDPAGEAVLFLHGYTDTSRSFLGTMRELARLRPELRLLALDQRGHGGSSLPAAEGCRAHPERCFEPRDLAADALAFLDAQGIERAHVVGHSLGSIAAMELALLHPGRVGRIALVASTARIAGNEVARAFVEGLLEGAWKQALVERGHAFPEAVFDLAPGAAGPLAEQWIAVEWVAEPAAPPELLAEILSETRRVPLGVWIGAARALLAVDLEERLAELRAPTLVLWGTQDPFFIDSDQARLRDALERAFERHGTPWAWKQYGRRPLPPEGELPDELAHNFHWAVPGPIAGDLAAFLRPDGAPTRESCTVEPGAPPRVLIEPDAAIVIERGIRRGAER